MRPFPSSGADLEPPFPGSQHLTWWGWLAPVNASASFPCYPLLAADGKRVLTGTPGPFPPAPLLPQAQLPEEQALPCVSSSSDFP